MHVHILGTGAVGCYYASLLKMNNYKVTLLLRSENHLTELKKKHNTIIYRTKDTYIPVEGFGGENVFNNNNEPIEALVVATKALYTLEALQPIVSRLTENTTLLLLQNGMGVADELVEKLFQDIKPRILIGVNRHGIERVAPFEIIHHSGYQEQTAVVIGEYPTTKAYDSVSEFANVVTGIEELRARYLPWQEVKVKIASKLVINMSVNGITTVMECRNKALTYHKNPAAMNLMRGVCYEAYQVLKDDLPNETPETLLEHTLEILTTAGENTCSTLQDLKAKRLTEIDYLNGYVCKRGKILNIPTPVNQTLVDLVHAKECTYDMPI
ncbi:2-dehydropantoate 2-reductase [Backusella circina FSU 941]|nr:2-dehydropantoate 2-reductase [Backusella circina FSU 941]